jgi:hypothetical protein
VVLLAPLGLVFIVDEEFWIYMQLSPPMSELAFLTIIAPS